MPKTVPISAYTIPVKNIALFLFSCFLYLAYICNLMDLSVCPSISETQRMPSPCSIMLLFKIRHQTIEYADDLVCRVKNFQSLVTILIFAIKSHQYHASVKF